MRIFKRHPHANLGVHLGKSKLLVFDVDKRNGGFETLAALEAERGVLNPPIVAHTGGGGVHFFYQARPSPVQLPSTLGPGVDLLYGNRFPVLPPSTHASGIRYKWKKDRDPVSNAFLLYPPDIRFFGTQASVSAQRRKAPLPLDETPEEEARLRSALDHIPADGSHDHWRDILYGIHATGWASAEQIALDWSLSVDGCFTEEGFRLVWNYANANRPGGRTVASIFYEARRKGWIDPKDAEPDTRGDISNGRRFAQRYHGQLLFMRSQAKWYRWDGNRWAPSDGEELQAAKRVADDMVTESSLAFTQDPSDTNKRGWALALAVHRNAKRLREMLAMGSSEPGMSVADPTAFDADPLLLGVRNGVVDLRTGRLMAAHPSQLISRQAAASFDPSAECPRFKAFLDRVFGDPEIIAFVQRAAGYSVTGLVDEEKLFFAFGGGANGKSVFANVICDVLGDYAVTVGTELLARTKHEGEAGRYRMRLPGARLALANEVGSGDTWDDKQVKELVSRERIPARALYGEAFDFMPTHKLWIRGNHKPGILDAGNGLWRRFVLIGFEREIPEEERVPDLDRQILDAERDGILRWLIEGCLAWMESGLGIPDSIARTTAEYREDSDVLGAWIAERCQRSPGARLESAKLYVDFHQYIRDAGMVPPPQPVFVRRMGQRGIRHQRSNGVSFLHDLAFRDLFEVGEDEDL
jgi:P4 family phage/plasmid primase-like protien